MLGSKKHVVCRCDEEEGHTWDVYRRGEVVAQCFATRREAQAEAKQLNAAEEAAVRQARALKFAQALRRAQ